MSTKIETHLDFRQNQAQNLVIHNLASAPSTPKEGQEYYNTATKQTEYWNGEKWVTNTTIASDSEVEAGTSITVAVNPKQLKTALDTKQTKLGYTPENITNKTTILNANSTLEQYPAAKTVYTEIELKAPKASPVFTGTPKAPTPIAGDSSTQLATTEFVTNAVNTAITGALVYKGVWNTSSASDYSALNVYRPLKKGNYFRVTGSGCTIDGVVYRAGDIIAFNRDIATSTTITTAAIDHYDHTDNEGMVLLDDTQTLTNKTINADNNTISNLEIDNFKFGVVHTSISANPSNTYLLTEKAVADGLTLKAPLASPSFTGTPTAPTPATTDNTTKIATTQYVKNVVNEATAGLLKKAAYNNTLIAPVDGVCTWTITHTLGTTDIICRVTEVSSGREVIMDKIATSSTVFTIKFNAAASVAANTYRAVLIGV